MDDVFTNDWKYNPDYHRAADFFGISVYDREDQGTAERISKLVDSVSQRSNAKSLNEALLNIHKIKKDLGLNTTGKTLLNEIYQYNSLKEDTLLERKQRDQQDKQLQKVTQVEKKKEDPYKKVKIQAEQIGKKVQTTVQKTISDSINKGISQALKSSLQSIKI